VLRRVIRDAKNSSCLFFTHFVISISKLHIILPFTGGFIMRKPILLLLLLAVGAALPLLAQEKTDAPAAPAMPKALDDDFCKWMVGEWEGTSTTPMGPSQDWQKFEMSLDNQFIITHFTGSMNGQVFYRGMGPMSIDPKTGDYFGYWFDNMRGVYKGTGKREGNKLSMTWSGPEGEVRKDTTEMVSADKMVITYIAKMPDGSVENGRGEYTRTKSAAK